jgi:nitroreductase
MAGRHVRREIPLSELVRTRRATDNFSSEPVPDSDLQEILRAGLEAPSSYNLQPWRFVVVRDLNQRKKLQIAALDQQKVEEAPVVIVACGDTRGWSEDLEEVVRIGKAQGVGDDAWAERKRKNVTSDLGSHPNMSMWVAKQTMIAATTMMWMAEALGYDTGPMEGFDEEHVKAVLNIPAHVRVLFLLAIGHLRGEDGKYPGRLSPARTLFSETYGQPFPMERVTPNRRSGRAAKLNAENNNAGLIDRLSGSR